MTTASGRTRAAEHSPESPTLEDVAERSGVSTATVSRCLNNPSVVSEKTRVRVMEAVKMLGYAPNFGARALAAKRTNTFGAIIPTMENAVFARGLQAFQEELERNGITLLVASSSYRPDMEEKQVQSLVARGADALLLIGHDRTPDTYEFLEKRQIPYVIAWVHDDSETRNSIGFDNRKAMKMLANKVLDYGHRSLGLITARPDDNDRARHRLEGIRDAMVERGLNKEALQIVETTYSISHGAEALSQLLQSSNKPTAVLCGNDVLAAGALKEARKQGLKVPEDISITGFDDIEIAEIVTPALTTVHVPHLNMGKGAAKLLLAMRNGEEVDQQLELDATVVERESLGRAPD